MRSPTFPTLLTAAALVYVGYRLVLLQHTEGEALRERASRQQTLSYAIAAQRGNIVDRKGRVLAGSVREPSVVADPSFVTNYAFDSVAVADALGLDARALEQDLLAAGDRQFMWVQRNVDEQAAARFRAARERYGLRAFRIEMEPKRVYPAGRLASHVIGSVSRDERGQAGVELTFDEELSGRPGRRFWTAAVRRRQRIERLDDRFEPPVDGASVILTLDAHIQQQTEDRLQAAVREFGADWAVAVVLDPHTGDVLAMATAPDFDPARPIPPGLDERGTQAAFERMRNRAVTDQYEPGSIFKPFVAAPAVDDGITSLQARYEIGGTERRFGRRVIHDTHEHDVLTLAEVISQSSNIGMAMLGERCGNERINGYIRRFGFGDVSGIDLPGEVDGHVHPLRDWTGYSTQSVPFGQEIAVTGLQVAAAFAVFGSDGVLMRPRVVRGVVAADGETLLDNAAPIPVRRVLSRESARAFRIEALAEVVRSGTGDEAQLPDYSVFGKTGTAQVARLDGRGYEPGAYIGSFVCGGPVDKPRVIVLVSLKLSGRPKRYYGGTVAAPTAARIVAETLAYLGVPPDIPSQTQLEFGARTAAPVRVASR